MTSNQLYREHILDLWKNPLNFGNLESANKKHKEFNSLCGDEIEIQLEIKDNKINNVKFNGSGCVISIASASLLTESIKGKTINEISSINKDNILKKLNIEISPARIKCALLSLEALQKSLK